MTGFTGVAWDGRDAVQLATDLESGPGERVVAEAALAWGDIAAEIIGAAIEYEAVMDKLGSSWRSRTASTAVSRLSILRMWLSARADDAAAAAIGLQGQSAAMAVARAAMPDPAIVQAADALAATTAAVVALAPLAQMVSGAVAHAERAAQLHHTVAARVMSAYESASEALACSTHTPKPPPALGNAVGQMSTAAVRTQSQAAVPRTPEPGAPVIGVTGVMPTRVLTRHTPTILAAATPPPTPMPSPAEHTAPTGPSPAAIPPTGLAGIGPRGTAEKTMAPTVEVSTNTAAAVPIPARWSEIAGMDVPLTHLAAPPVHSVDPSDFEAGVDDSRGDGR